MENMEQIQEQEQSLFEELDNVTDSDLPAEETGLSPLVKAGLAAGGVLLVAGAGFAAAKFTGFIDDCKAGHEAMKANKEARKAEKQAKKEAKKQKKIEAEPEPQVETKPEN